jgi:hypothetical protein
MDGSRRPAFRQLCTALVFCGLFAAPPHAQVLHDDSLPAATPRELQQLADDRLRQKIMSDSIAIYHGACTCPYQVRRNGRSCRGHIHVLKGHAPICFPGEITGQMLAVWRHDHQAD